MQLWKVIAAVKVNRLTLVRIIECKNLNFEGHKVVKGDKCMGVSQLLGSTCPGCPPKSTPMYGNV